GRHGELGELRGAGGGDEVGRRVDRASRGVDVPQPADVFGEIEAHPGDALTVEVAGCGQAGGPGPDDGDWTGVKDGHGYRYCPRTRESPAGFVRTGRNRPGRARGAPPNWPERAGSLLL